jgi:Flp pilus assembly protein TadD
MTRRRLVSTLLVALMLQAGLFGVLYRDLLWLNGSLTVLQAAALESARRTAGAVLERKHVSRRHLESLALATNRPELLAEHVQTLTRLRELSPDEPTVALRLADALRRARRHDEARALFMDVLEGAGR